MIMQVTIQAILDGIIPDEEAEKEMDKADKEVTKAFNLSNYKEDIMNKPRK